MNLNIRTQALLLSAVPLAAMLVVLALAIAYSNETRQTAYWANHSQDVLDQSSSVMQAIGEENRAAITYAKTRAAKDLRAFNHSVDATTQRVTRLQSLVTDNPAQIRHARSYAGVVKRVNAFLRNYVLLSPAAQGRAARDPATQRLGTEMLEVSRNFDRAERMLAVSRFQALGRETQTLGYWLLGALAAAIILTAVSLLTLSGRIVARLRRLSENIRRLGDGEDPIPLLGGDEVSAIDREFREMAGRMRREQAISSELQRALLPQSLPAIPGLRIDAAYRPAASGTHVGGDWFDVFVLDHDHVAITIGDITGHGLAAASAMASVRQSIQTAAHVSCDPGAVLELVNRTISDAGAGLASAFVAILNHRDGSMRYATAGHPAPVTLRATGTVGLLPAEGLLLGVDRTAKYECFETTAESGSAFIFYTDGAVETHRGNYARGLSDLIDAIMAEYYNGSENIAQAIVDRIFARKAPRDDCAIIFLGVTELAAQATARFRSWQIDAKAFSEARRLKRAFLWHLGQYINGESDLNAVELILGELLGNVARHTEGRATVTLELENSRALLHIEDRGEPIPPPPEDPDPFAEGGRGLLLVGALARELRITRGAAGNIVSAELPVSISSAAAQGEPRVKHP